jgi:asparagine synthase (glutamine-hydrolysing)
MRDSLLHRGPDDEGTWTRPGAETSGPHVQLGQRRLSILDLSPAGRNPMAWDGGRYWVTYNGEVYNWRELRAELEATGCAFRSHTDTEVVLAAYTRWGDECVARFNGMFAVAIWDEPRQRLFLARDRVGKKPLYYALYGERLTFASEQKALLADPEFPRDLDRDALALYLRYGYVPAPHSVFRASRKLPPGHVAVYESGRLSVRSYWDPVRAALLPRRAPASAGQALEELEALLKDAVRSRMVADVPVGAFLSGGIDSSLVSAMMCEAGPGRVKTYSIAFENPLYDESAHASAMARQLGTDHHQETCSTRRMLEIVERLPGFLDEPFADSSAIPTYLVSRFAREEVTVVLTGDGGDEVFFGYPRYLAVARRGTPLTLPFWLRRVAADAASLVPHRKFRRAAEVLRSAEADEYARFVVWWPRPAVEEMTGLRTEDAPAYAAASRALGATDRRLRPPVLDLVTYLPEDILFKVDRMSMAVSLESRCPLLDSRVVEFGLSLPPSMLFGGGTGKVMLRTLLAKRVPAALFDRPKMGFGVPLEDWFRGPLREQMEEALRGGQLQRLGLDPRAPRRQWKDFLAGRAPRTDVLWNVFSLVRWAERWS